MSVHDAVGDSGVAILVVHGISDQARGATLEALADRPAARSGTR